MSSTETSASHARLIEQYIPKNKIFIDTCSVMHENANVFLADMKPLLQKYQQKLIVPFAVWQELVKHSQDVKDPTKKQLAHRGQKLLLEMQAQGLLEFRGEKTDTAFADHVFQSVIVRHRLKHNLLLITQDENLAKDIFTLNLGQAVKGKRITVMRIQKDGTARAWFFPNLASPKAPAKPTAPKPAQPPKVAQTPPAPIEKGSPVRLAATPPGIGTTLYMQDPKSGANSPVTLSKELANGGEGVIYETNRSMVAKIYKKDCNTPDRFAKLRLMLMDPICCEGICAPQAALYNANGEFVGFLMPHAAGKELQRSLFIPKPLFQQRYPTWKKRDTVELCVTILKKIKFLHSKNVIMGDINPNNILVVSPKEVYFVDTDSYQIGNFPCPVGTTIFTAPEIQGKRFTDFLRTKGQEHFAIATLLFMIMLPGKPPYSQQGGEDPVRNIISMNFSYPLGDKSNGLAPDGAWRFMWSHLPYNIKDAFYNTFQRDGKYAVPEERLGTEEWLRLFENYLALLDSGKFGEQDKLSEEIFPMRFKRSPYLTYVKCHLCQNEYPEEQTQAGICHHCLKEGDTYQCKQCGKPMILTNYQKYVKGVSKPYEVCPDCYARNMQVVLRPSCSVCGNRFEITHSEMEFYRSKGMEPPKRCKQCRQQKKQELTSFRDLLFPNTPPVTATTPPPKKRKRFLFF